MFHLKIFLSVWTSLIALRCTQGMEEMKGKKGLMFYSNNRFGARKKSTKNPRSCDITFLWNFIPNALFHVSCFMFFVVFYVCFDLRKDGRVIRVAMTSHLQLMVKSWFHHIWRSSSGGLIFLLTHPNGPGDSSYSTCFSNIWLGRSSSC